MLRSEIETKILVKVQKCMVLAEQKLGKYFAMPVVEFKLRGTTAGTAQSGLNRLNFNMPIALLTVDEFIHQTVPHECAHIVADLYYGHRVVHGRGWKYVMRHVYGLEPKRCHCYAVPSGTTRRSTQYRYACGCKNGVIMGAIRHKRLQTGQYRYLRCKRCDTQLTIDTPFERV